jgi:hypothetical protein
MKFSIYFLIIYLPFEELILKYLPISDSLYEIVRQLPDLIVFTVFILLLMNQTLTYKKITILNRQIITYLISFIAYATFLIVINESSIFNCVLNIKAILRYVPLIYIIYNIKFAHEELRFVVKLIVFIALIQSIIGLFEVSGLENLRSFFEPRGILMENGKFKYTALREQEAAFGTMAYTVNYASFLVLSTLLVVKLKLNRILTLVLTGLFMLLTFLSGSRGLFLIVIFIYYMFLLKNKHNYKVSKIKFTLITSISILVLPLLFFNISLNTGSSNADFFFFLSPEFYEMLEHQRLGILRMLFDNFFNLHVLMGLSPDPKYLENFVLNSLNIPPLLNIVVLGSLEDVYWVALYFYYGLIGLMLFLLFIISIYKYLESSFKTNPLYQDDLFIIKSLFFIYIVGSFMNQIPEIRQFTYYFWLIIAIYMNLALLERRKTNENHIGT